MTGLEDSVKGKVFYKTENGEYQELGELKSIEIEKQNKEEYMNIRTETKAEFEYIVNNKDTIRKLKQLMKTDKDKKSEKRFNKGKFRAFISNI